ncbi:threonine/serine exporter family protein [Dokdonella sp.]|uniref:threonine/serine ThrE exporter family protein n=1 Tax=Dokdonella sp. TaxID=2291710 RepID=UPI001B027384|nr:threonine/serine exporter family protein [Dokdonella sp.]MBO9664724.1 threonine/serine exporter family protein [Dokdonella sp.]
MGNGQISKPIGGEVPLKTRIGFVVELARRLHEYGTAAPRLEDVVNLVSARLGLVCNVLSTPTSIVMSFSDLASSDDDVAEVTQVVRLPPGEVNLKALCRTDEIANRVIAGEIGLAEGRRLLREVGVRRPRLLSNVATVFSYGVAAAAIAIILHSGWVEAGVAGLIGLFMGLVALAAQRWASFSPAAEAVSAFLATAIATAVAAWIVPLALRSVVIASLIVLMPGMTLTTAVRELSTQHLISGTARMMGAVSTLLKLTFGTVVAVQACTLLGILPRQHDGAGLSSAIEWGAVVAAALSFAVLFKSPLRHVPVVVAAVLLGYACTQLAGTRVSPAFGTFLGSVAIGAASNLFARLTDRPGALVREPGIILLVPGSVGFRTLSFVFENDVQLGFHTAITLVTLLIAIVAGLLFGDLLVPPRRKL